MILLRKGGKAMRSIAPIFFLVIFVLLVAIPNVQADMTSECGGYLREYMDIMSWVKELDHEFKDNVRKYESIGGRRSKRPQARELTERRKEILREKKALSGDAGEAKNKYKFCIEDYKRNHKPSEAQRELRRINREAKNMANERGLFELIPNLLR